MVFLLVNYFFLVSLLLGLLMPLNCKNEYRLLQNHTSVNGSWLIDQIGFHCPWSAQTSISPAAHTQCQGVLHIHRGCLANRNSRLDWRTKDFRIMFFHIMFEHKAYELFFLHSRSILHNLNWPGTSTITYLGCMPRFLSWYSTVINVPIARSFWIFPPFVAECIITMW